MDRYDILAEKLIAKWESFQSNPYRCPAGVWTIGYGTTVYPNGTRVTHADKPVTKGIAAWWVEYQVGKEASRLSALIGNPINSGQLGALCSLAYNIGIGVHDGKPGDLADSTLLAKLKAGDTVGAADQFLAWDKAHVNGKLVTLNGLRNRRLDERGVFLTGIFKP